MSLQTADFDYDLPEELIASHPLEKRDDSRLLLVNRAEGKISHHLFKDLPSLLSPDDLLVLNDTRVVAARYFSNDGKIELVRTEAFSETRWRCLVKPGKKMKVGRHVAIGKSTGTVISIEENGERIIEWDLPVNEEEFGKLALPHYMDRDDEPDDRERYQTVFAQNEGAIAAPTAGLHFTPEILSQFQTTSLTLHVGVGTFRPVKAENLEDHEMHSEQYALSAESVKRIHLATRVVSVGTTVTRVLEHLGRDGKELQEAEGNTDIFIYPPYQFQVVDALLTNFHLPQSTLLMLVSAFAGKDLILEAYQAAIKEKYRFFSYGDCMLII